MKSTPPLRKNPRTTKNVVHIGGIPVEFPYQPYGSQLGFMSRVISTLDRADRDGHCHALLESPTGTGKSLSLLCSALAWQQNQRSKKLYDNLSISNKPSTQSFIDPLGHGGGFVPQMEPSGNPEPATTVANSKDQKKKTAPTIFYATRTHSQITQVVREYRKTTYRVPMAVLASRKQYCTNQNLRGKDNIDEQCKLLLKDQEIGCSEFKNVHKVKGHPSLQKGGCHEAHDIEDLVRVGQVVRGCSYFAARSMAEDAQLVFCPYNYIINPIIRRAMEVDIKGAIVILDEAHNIEDSARDAGSVDVEDDVLHELQTELGQLTLIDDMTYRPLYEMIQEIISWIERRKNTLEKREFQHYFSCWSGDNALRELQEANISHQCFPILQNCATKAIKAVSDAEPEVARLSGMSATTLEGLFSSLSYFFSENGMHVSDYQLVLRRYIKRNIDNAAGDWTHSVSLWCLNSAVVFRGIADLSLSVILTSGTLSPMNSFSSELGIQFGTCLEAPHVIDVESQLWASVISSGPGNCPLNASYKTADGYAFQDALGTSLEEICKLVPGGCLVFFPSYKLMEKLRSRWHETGQWSRLNARKSLFVEPRGGSQDDFESVLNGYYNSIRHGNKPVIGRKRKDKKSDFNNHHATKCTENQKKGAAFLAVCRGKVSEGIDFSDDNARVVIIVGIPFPNINDIQVAQKKKFNDNHKSSKNLLSGNEWYCHQAFRALNQAAGRCIRHRFDYGAIIFLDERFREERNVAYISRWLRKSIRQYESFGESLEGLKSFFVDIKERFGKTANVLQSSDIDEDICSMDEGKGFTRKKNQKVNKSKQCGNKLESNSILAPKKAARMFQSLSFVETQTEVQELASTKEKHIEICRKYIDLECDIEEYSRCSVPPSMSLSPDDPELTIVKETPDMTGTISVSTPQSFSKDEYSSSTIIQDATEFPDQLLLHPPHFSYSSAPPQSRCSLMVTPEKDVAANAACLIQEPESLLNLSVNSHTQKSRKSLSSSLVDHLQGEQFDTPNARTPGIVGTVASSVRSIDANRRIEFHCDTNCSENECKMPSNCDVSSGLIMDKTLRIFCELCKNSLGLPENNQRVTCLLTSSSKSHLVSLWKGTSGLQAMTTSSIPVLILDISSVNQLLYNSNSKGAPRQGIWCKEDGCVFTTILCPFCSNPDNCLGVQVMATDAPNIELLNKIMFYCNRLEIKNIEVSREKQDLSPCSGSSLGKRAVLNPIEKFSYIPQHQSPDGWRSTKSKMRLPKRVLSAGECKSIN